MLFVTASTCRDHWQQLGRHVCKTPFSVCVHIMAAGWCVIHPLSLVTAHLVHSPALTGFSCRTCFVPFHQNACINQFLLPPPLFSSPPFYLFYFFSIYFFFSFQENINIDEAANCLVKHIIASENDMLQSEAPDTITPQLEKDKGGTCSSCFRSQ